MNKIKVLCIIMLCLLIPAGCQHPGTETAESPKEGYPVTVTNGERTVTVNRTPEKILTLGPNCTELFVALGLGDLIIGRSLVNHSKGPLDEYADIINNIPEISHGSVTREGALTSGADFIYTVDWEIGDSGINIDEAKKYGINVYVNSATTLEEQFREIEDIGKIFNITHTSEAFIKDQRKQIADVQEKISAESPVKVLVYDSGNNGIFTCSGENFESELISLAGGKNIFDDMSHKQWITVSYEEVLKRNPHVIVIHDYDAPTAEEKIREIKENPVLSNLDCVKNNRFVIVPLENVLPGNRMAYTISLFAKAFYPEIFK